MYKAHYGGVEALKSPSMTIVRGNIVETLLQTPGDITPGIYRIRMTSVYEKTNLG